jgi:DNA helicase II / ATP-dependent DNA helicase PcrA
LRFGEDFTMLNLSNFPWERTACFLNLGGHKMATSWSKYQQAIFDAIRSTRDNLCVQARSGSGKTTTLVEALKHLVGRTLFLAYNKVIANELEKRVPQGTEARTTHSYGLSLLAKHFRSRVPLDENKVPSMIKANFTTGRWNYDHRPLANAIDKAVEHAKNHLVESVSEIVSLLSRFHVEIPTPFGADLVAEYAVEILARCKKETASIDYNDMIWLPVVLNVSPRRFDTILVDECQDLNPCQIELISRTVGQSGRVVLIGDDRQSIYGFRGADVDAMDKMTARFKARKMSLPLSYRCPKSVAKLAKEIVSDFEVLPEAIEGRVTLRTEEDMLVSVASDDFVLCRTMHPLVSLFFTLIRQGVKAFVRGRDFGKGLVSFINSFKAERLNELCDEINAWKIREVQKLTDAGKETAAQTAADKCDCVLTIALNVDTIKELIDYIWQIFQKEGTGVCLSTMHRVKGLEADRVWILHPELVPHPCARQAWEKAQEANLAYMAVTRSKNELIFVNRLPGWRPSMDGVQDMTSINEPDDDKEKK